MTIDKRDYIKIPNWLITLALPALVSAFVAFSSISSSKAVSESKIQKLEQDTQNLQDNKIDRNEFNLIIKQLDEIKSAIKDKK